MTWYDYAGPVKILWHGMKFLMYDMDIWYGVFC